MLCTHLKAVFLKAIHAIHECRLTFMPGNMYGNKPHTHLCGKLAGNWMGTCRPREMCNARGAPAQGTDNSPGG